MSILRLSGITWDHARGYDPLVASAKQYLQLNNISIDWQKRSLSNFGDQSLNELANHFDLLIIDHPHTGVAAATQCLLPLDEWLPAETINQLSNESAGPCFSSYHYKENQWALPVDAAMQCAAYRPDLLPGFRLPHNWEEVFALNEVLRNKGLWSGMALCPTDCLCSFLSITAQAGSPIQEGNPLLVSREAGLKALDQLRYMRDHFHPQCLNWNPVQLYDHMSTQEDIAYSPLAFCYTNYSRDGFKKNKLIFSNAPGISQTVLGGAGIAVSACCKNPEEAVKYAAWLCSAEIQNSIYIIAQGQPASLSAWKNEDANDLTNNFFFNTIDSLTNAFVRPRYTGWPAFQQWLGETIHAFLKNDTDPVSTLENLQQFYKQSYTEVGNIHS